MTATSRHNRYALYLRVTVFVGGVYLLQCLPCAVAAVQAPVLKWQGSSLKGGCENGWAKTGWYSSPEIADLNGDGTNDIIAANSDVFAVDGAYNDGTHLWKTNPPGDRVISGVQVVDLDNDGDLEVVSAHRWGYLNVFDHEGNIVWTQRPTTAELNSLETYDLDGDGTLEIIVGAGGTGDEVTVWVYEHNGDVRAGWPQLANPDDAYVWGIFGNNIGVDDIDGDDRGEIIVPCDNHYISAYEDDGGLCAANAVFRDHVWGKVGVWWDYDVEKRGWGNGTTPEESFRTVSTDGAATIVDVNADGTKEIVVIGDVYDLNIGHYTGAQFEGIYIFNADRTRFKTGPYDWETIPSPPSLQGPYQEYWDYNRTERRRPYPVVEDLDGDGIREILFASYDGGVHAFWLDKTEHGNWPYMVYDPAEGFDRYASAPSIVDFDNDGYAEVVFCSWVQKTTDPASARVGKLHILSWDGTVLYETNLPPPLSTARYWNGSLTSPAIGNVDGDPDMEIVVNTVYSGLVVYDMPGTENAHVLWRRDRAGPSPTVYAPRLAIHNNNPTLTFSKLQSNATYHVEVSPNLLTGPWSTGTTFTATNVSGAWHDVDAATENVRFYRLKGELP